MRETNGSEHTSIGIKDVEQQLVSSIQRKLCSKPPLPAQCCIFRVPISLRRHNENAYVPNLVSIGPFHHGKESLKEMERVKLWYLHCLLDRSPTAETSLDYFVKAIRGMESDLRECYAEQHSLRGDQFIEMMVVDGCFIIELFRKYGGTVLRDDNDPVFNMCWMYLALANDLLLLENQLPWLVLERLWNLTMTNDEPEDTNSLPTHAFHFFNAVMMPLQPQSNRRFRNKHLLDFMRSILLSSFADTELDEPKNEIHRARQTNRKFRQTHILGFLRNKRPSLKSILSLYKDTQLEGLYGILIPCVTELLQAGVKFKRGNKNDILNIKFDNGVMEIPPILIRDNAGSLFRNLIAFEQCDPNRTTKITSYALLLDNLINSSKEVDFLCHKGIVLNSLSSEDIAGFFNRLYNDTDINDFPYRELCKQVNAYHKARYSRWHRWQSILRRDYFNNPWSILSFLAAISILGLTFTQTLLSIFSYSDSLSRP